MTDQVEPYIDRDPGDLITAEDWDGVQIMIKNDIDAKIDESEQEIKRTGVDRATNADKFGGKSDTEWVNDLNDRYAPKVHDHEGQSVYRRFIKRFTNEGGMDSVLLEHDLGRYPIVDVYELLPVVAKPPVPADPELEKAKLLFYYGHKDTDDFGLVVRVGRGPRVQLGLPFEQVLAELGVVYEDDDTIEDVLNDMWTALWKPPNDELDHATSPWVDECCGQRRTVADLKRSDQWADLLLAVKPQKFAMIGKPTAQAGGGRAGAAAGTHAEITHVNYRSLLVKTTVVADAPLDLMFLLRI